MQWLCLRSPKKKAEIEPSQYFIILLNGMKNADQ